MKSRYETGFKKTPIQKEMEAADMAGIREVAKLAGVSPSTVSRVMNGTAKVDEEKKQRVLAAISETGFKPNELARALFKKSSKIIGVIVPNIENPFFNELARSIEEEAYQNGFRMLLCSSDDNTEKELMNIQILTQMNADGIIIMTNSDKTGKAVAECSIPVVLVDRKISGGNEIAFIESDHYKGGKIAAEHLIQCGCKNIVCMKGPVEFSSGENRYKGYLDACRQYGIPEQSINCTYDYEAGLTAAKELLEKYPDVDGIIACNDMAAISTYKVLTEAGYKVPDDIQLIGFDNINFSRMFTPELTTVAQPITNIGTLAVQIILRHGEGMPFQKENILDVKLISRQTTKKRSK